MDHDRDERMISWLEEGPWAPATELLDSAVAYARTHQPRALPGPGFRRSALGRISLISARAPNVRPRFRNRALAMIAAAALMTVALLAGAVVLSQLPRDTPGVGGPTSSSEDGSVIPTGAATVPPPAGAIVRSGSDPAGDATGEGADIVSVTTVAMDDEVLLEVEATEAWTVGGRLRILLETGFGPSPAGGTPMPLSSPYRCWGWVAEAMVDVSVVNGSVYAFVSGADERYADAILTALDASVRGVVLSVTLPLSVVGDPDSLYVAVQSMDRLDGLDSFGDIVDDVPSCHRAMP